jgi:hypothetical protein
MTQDFVSDELSICYQLSGTFLLRFVSWNQDGDCISVKFIIDEVFVKIILVGGKLDKFRNSFQQEIR